MIAFDHVFVFVEPGAAVASEALTAAGLVESYRRAHPGQGTSNACYCFDNAFVELLWLEDRAEAEGPLIARTGLAERASWQSNGASPFGIAWRQPRDESSPIPVWHYTPPYLPPGMAIDVAVASDDPREPMLFRSPATAPPVEWTERSGARQTAAGLSTIHIELHHPAPSEALCHLGQLGVLTIVHGTRPRLDVVAAEDWRMELPLRLGD